VEHREHARDERGGVRRVGTRDVSTRNQFPGFGVARVRRKRGEREQKK
jgi:hypothetical protein